MDGTDGTLSQLGSPQESNASFLRSPKIVQLMPLSTNTKKFDRQIGNISVLNVNSDHALQMMFCPQLRDINPKRKLPKYKRIYEQRLKGLYTRTMAFKHKCKDQSRHTIIKYGRLIFLLL